MFITRALMLIIILFFPLTMTGCLETSAHPVAKSLNEMSVSSAQSTRCIVNSLSGLMCAEKSTINTKLKQKLHQTGIVEDGFVFQSAKLMTLKQDKKNPEIYTAKGRMLFADPLQRRIWVDYNTIYKTGDALKITEATATLASKVLPESICFVVKSDDLMLDTNKLPGFVELYQRAGHLAITPASVQNDPEQEYLILVFFMDKTTPSAKMQLRLSETSSEVNGFDKSSHYINYNNGWRVGIVKGKMNLLNPVAKNSLYLKAVYIPGKEVGFLRTPKLVGLYSLIDKNKK